MKLFQAPAFLALAPVVPGFAALTDIIGHGLTTQSQLDRAIGATSTIQHMKFEPKKVAEVTAGIDKLVSEMKLDKQNLPALVSKFSEHLIYVNNQFVKHNANGKGDVAGAQPQGQPQRGKVGAGARAS